MLSARVDPLLGELCGLASPAGSGGEGEGAVGSALVLSALTGLEVTLRLCGDKASPAALTRARATIFQCVTAVDEEDAALGTVIAKCTSATPHHYPVRNSALFARSHRRGGAGGAPGRGGGDRLRVRPARREGAAGGVRVGGGQPHTGVLGAPTGE